MLAGWAISVRVWRWFGGTDGNKINDGKGGKASKVVVKVEHIRRRFGRTVALEDVSLELAAGQEKAVLGTCSAGKSTLIKSILDERCPYVRRARGTTVGYCPQEPQLLAHLTVEEWLGLVRAIRGIPEDPGDDTADSADADDGDDANTDDDDDANADTERDNRVIWELNAGERRWVALLTATIGSTLVLLDEPTSEMSPKLKLMAWKKIQELKQRGVSVLIATHDVDEAERADEILVLSRGISVFTGTELELRRRFGCGYMLNIRVSGTMADNVQSLVTKTLGTKAVVGKVTSADGYCTFDVPHEMEDRLPRLLTTLDMNKSLFGVEDVQLRAATIANSFMTLIKQVELEAAVREGRYELLLVAEEGIALKIPIGSDLVESPSGSLYSVTWGTDPSTGRLTITNYDRALYY